MNFHKEHGKQDYKILHENIVFPRRKKNGMAAFLTKHFIKNFVAFKQLPIPLCILSFFKKFDRFSHSFS